MGLLPSLPMFFYLIMFISFCFHLSRAIDCGGNQVQNTIVVDQQVGKGNFVTIQSAINSIKINNNQWIKIHINPGIYRERVYITIGRPCVILEGSGSNVTTVRWGYHQKVPRWLATFSSSSPNVIVSGITFENTYNLEGGSHHIKQALAAGFYADKAAIFNCRFLGYQDTLFAALGRHYFKNCYIQGEGDFIFGSGQSYFENCLMNATSILENQGPGFVTAQRRDSPNDPNGFVFKEGSIVGNGQINLGRPWGPYSRVIFWGTYFSSVVTPEGWDAWNYPGQVNQLTYAEVNCTGPGANTDSRVYWMKKYLNDSDLNQYSLSSFINQDGWLSNLPPISF